MLRLVEASRVLREAVPDELVPLVWAITLLGSAKFLVLGLSLVYWNVEEYREELLALVSVGFVGLAVTLALKYGFDLPRPPAAVQRYPVEPSPVGFPSGHAIAATTIYGGALLAFDRYRDPRAVAGVAGLVVAVSLSRVVLGVHYLGDVVAGVVVGLVVLGGATAVFERGAVSGFAAAAVLSVPALVTTGGTADAALALGGSIGGLAGAARVPRSVPLTSRSGRALLNVCGVVFVVALMGIEELVEGMVPVVTAVNLVLALGIVAMPLVVDHAPLPTVRATDR
ncbi:MAG: phosphatase PAP2 family protein [Haloarculaceae archaeon]